MELGDVAIVGSAFVLVGYAFVFGFLRRLNDWYYVAGRRRRRRRESHHDDQFPLPPGDMGWPLLGNMPSFFKSFKSQPDSFISHLVSRYGRTGIYRTHLFGRPSIIVCNADICRKVLTDDDGFKLGYPTSTVVLTGKRSMHNVSNAEHKRLRRLTTAPITGHEALCSYLTLMEDEAVKTLDELSSMQTPVELLTELKKFTFAVIINIFFFSDIGYINLDHVKNLYTDLFQGIQSLAINLPGFAFHKALKARKKLAKILLGMLEKRRSEKKDTTGKKDMMDMLMEEKDEEGRKLEDEEIIDLLLGYLLAGHESTAHSIMWILIYLSQHPHVFQKAKKEQEEIIGRRPSLQQEGLSLKEIKQMEYLSKVTNEMLRMNSNSFASFREAKVDVTINGYSIPKGWKVLVWNRSVHMDPENYVNPEDFDPSRWENFKAKAGSFLPFGLGSRYCPGSELARLEIAIFLHHYLLNYRMERINEKCPVVYLPTPRPTDNCLARIIKVDG